MNSDSSSADKLILFDVDWTLIKGRIPGVINSFEYGFKKVYGVNASINDAAPYEGKTDRQIIFEVLQNKGLERKNIELKLNEMFLSMVEYVQKNIKKKDVVALPGAKDFLEKLKGCKYKLGVLTGNVQRIAEIKLDFADLKYFFEIGAYGSESEKRSELVEMAKERANKKFGHTFSNSDIYLVGDSIRDISCGKETGIKTIGVTTGLHKNTDLENAGADLVLSNLEEAEKGLEFIKR